jgi:hypothetical protein
MTRYPAPALSDFGVANRRDSELLTGALRREPERHGHQLLGSNSSRGFLVR